MRRIFAPLFLLVIFLSGCGLTPVTEPRRFDPADEPTPVPTTAAILRPSYSVQRGDVIKRLVVSGRVVPIAQTELSFPVAGQVASIEVGRGDLVAAGDILVTLDTASLRSALDLAQTALDVAQDRLAAVESQLANDRRRAQIALDRAQLKLDYARAQAADDPDPEATLEVQLLELDVELAQIALSELSGGVDLGLQADVSQAQLQVDELNAAIAASALVAPEAGTVLSLDVSMGDSIQPGRRILVIADLTRLEITASVTRSDAMEALSEGMAVNVVPAGRPGDSADATIAILPFPYGTGEPSDDGTIHVRFDDDAAAADVALGDRMLVEMILGERFDTLWLPPAAVRDFQGRRFVVLQEGETQRRVDVTIGLDTDERLEILDGVEEGQTVIGQ